jgi:ABC-type dipeptide/oligopeptide/nickel transport system permease component
VLKRDYPLVEAAVFAGAAASLGGSILGDWMQTWVDPRLREGS